MLVILRNANAGKRRHPTSAKKLLQHIGARGHLIETHSLDELAQAAQDVRRAAPRLIALWGGDGTITATLSALLRAYQETPLPPVCLLPGGTMNVVARSLIPKHSPQEILEQLVTRFHQNANLSTKRRTLIRLEEQFGFLFGIGLMANFLEALYEGNQAGAVRSAYVLGRACVEAIWGGGLIPALFQPFEAKVIVDGKPWLQERWVNISAGGVEDLGFGFRPYLRCAEREGFYHLIGHDLDPLGVVRELPNIKRGRGMRQVSQDIVQRVTIETSRPMTYSFEGELYPPRASFELQSGPTLQLVVP